MGGRAGVVCAVLGSAVLHHAASAVKAPPVDVDEIGKLGRDRRARHHVSMGERLDAVGQQELDMESNMSRYMNDCAQDDAFMKSMRDLRPTCKWQRYKLTMENLKGPTMLISSTFHVNCYVDNFLSHLARNDFKSRVVVFNLDREAQTFCENRQRRVKAAKNESNVETTCINMVPWVDDGVASTGPDRRFHRQLGYDTCDYIRVTWTKPVLMLYAAKFAKYPVMMIDSDIIVHGNIFKWIKENTKPKTRVVVLDDGGHSHNRPNTGITYVDPSHKDSTAHDVLFGWVEQAHQKSVIESGRGEQESLGAVINATNSWEHIEFIPKDIVGQCGKTNSDYQLATHYNCLGRKTVALIDANRWHTTDAKCLPEALLDEKGVYW